MKRLPLPVCKLHRLGLLALLACTPWLSSCSSDDGPEPAPAPRPTPEPAPPKDAALPNILFIVMDDLGVDQLSVFGFGGVDPARTPTLAAVAQAGVRFRNTWSMPTCTPSRAAMFEGRYPFRTDVLNAIVALDLANSQVSPYAVTTPRMLKEKGYVNALIGKMHLSGSNLNPANNPLGHEAMRELGWDYFEGYLDGAPYPIDTTAGGVGRAGGGGEAGAYGCGFVPNAADDPEHGADSGACYLPAGGCTAISTASAPTPGRACLEQGGIFDPGQSCRAQAPSYIDFATQNGYYTAEWIINREDGSTELIPPSDARGRGYRSTLETDRALAWLKRRTGEHPWMLSVGYSAIHTPLQPPPASLLPDDAQPTGAFDCVDARQQRVLSDQMLEAMDHEIGRLLVEAGLASRRADGTLDYRPEQTDTMVVIVSDNGTFLPSVKAPFNPTRAKATPYQGGVWVPLIVAGPLVQSPGRDVAHMVNTTDLFSLFGELAGVDVRAAVPAARALDAQPVLPYLAEPDRASIRATNYTEMGTNLTSTRVPPAPPCVVPAANLCAQIFPQKQVCEDQGGVWYGQDGAAGSAGLASCCAVNAYLEAQGSPAVDILPASSRAIRNEHYKLVRFERMDCATGQLEPSDELYWIDEASPLPRLDHAVHDLLDSTRRPGGLEPQVQQQYQALSEALEQLVTSEVPCPGDGNRDQVVDQRDVDNWRHFSTHNGGRSSWYDLNHDGLTDEADLAIIRQHLGRACAAG